MFLIDFYVYERWYWWSCLNNYLCDYCVVWLLIVNIVWWVWCSLCCLFIGIFLWRVLKFGFIGIILMLVYLIYFVRYIFFGIEISLEGWCNWLRDVLVVVIIYVCKFCKWRI